MGMFEFWHPELPQKFFVTNFEELDDLLGPYCLDQAQVEQVTGLPVEQAFLNWSEVLEGKFGPEAQRMFKTEEKVMLIFHEAEAFFESPSCGEEVEWM